MRIERRWRSETGGTLLLALLVLAGCDPAAEQNPPSSPVTVTFTTLSPEPVELTDDLAGRVSAVRTAEIRPQVSGIVQRRLFEQGSEIRAGQALFQINPAPFKADEEMAAAALQRAQVAWEKAKIQVARLQPLVRADAISRQAYDDAVSQRDQAAADVAHARATLTRRRLDVKFATVEAPISGRVDQALVTEGALVAPSDAAPMAKIQQIDQVYVDVRQSASSLEVLQKLRPASSGHDSGSAVPILSANGDAYDLTGRILFSGITVDPGTGDVLLRILVNNPQRRLLPGMFVRARIPRASYAEALMVPQQAVVRTGGQALVWLIDGADRAHAKSVELGEAIKNKYHIVYGVGAGQRLVVQGMDRLIDGATVAPRPWTSTTPAVDRANR